MQPEVQMPAGQVEAGAAAERHRAAQGPELHSQAVVLAQCC